MWPPPAFYLRPASSRGLAALRPYDRSDTECANERLSDEVGAHRHENLAGQPSGAVRAASRRQIGRGGEARVDVCAAWEDRSSGDYFGESRGYSIVLLQLVRAVRTHAKNVDTFSFGRDLEQFLQVFVHFWVPIILKRRNGSPFGENYGSRTPAAALYAPPVPSLHPSKLCPFAVR